eukprot:180110_1
MEDENAIRADDVHALRPSQPPSLAIELEAFNNSSKEMKYASRARKLRFIATLFGVTCATIVTLQNMNIYKTICLISCIMSMQYIGLFVFIISTAKHLHYIQVDSIGIYGFNVFALPSNVQQKYNRCIMSLSGISALPGSSTQQTLLICNSMQFSLLWIAIIVKINEWKNNEENVTATQSTSIYLFFASITGMLVLALWNLERGSTSSLVMHYSGAGSVFFLCAISFMLYQNFSIFSIVLVGIQFATAAFYFVLVSKCPYKHDDIDVVHRISYWCIISELIPGSLSMFIAALYVWCMDGDVILFS